MAETPDEPRMPKMNYNESYGEILPPGKDGSCFLQNGMKYDAMGNHLSGEPVTPAPSMIPESGEDLAGARAALQEREEAANAKERALQVKEDALNQREAILDARANPQPLVVETPDPDAPNPLDPNQPFFGLKKNIKDMLGVDVANKVEAIAALRQADALPEGFDEG